MAHHLEIGQIFGDYVVISEEFKLSADKKRMFKVRCRCGREEWKRATKLVSGKNKRCKTCSGKKFAKEVGLPRLRSGKEGLSGTHFKSMYYQAKRRDIPFDLTPEFLWDMFVKQEGLCALSGVPIVLVFSHKLENVNYDIITASLDRIDSNKGYTEDNVWWVHKRVNKIKRDYPLQEVIDWCSLIHKKHGNPDPSAVNSVEVAAKEQRLAGEELTDKLATSARPPKYKGG
jgi:hypothetical protein